MKRKKTLLVMRHAKAARDESQWSDYDRPLNERGLADAARMGDWLRQLEWTPDWILASSALRTQETAERVAKVVEYQAPISLRDELYHAPPRRYLAEIRQAPASVQRLLLVGHNPEIQAFAIDLVGGTAFPDCLRALANQGRLAIVGYVDGVLKSEIDLEAVHGKRLRIFGISNTHLTAAERAEATRGFVRDVMPAVADGRITPVIDKVFPFAELPAAKAYAESNAQVGKIVVRLD